MEWKEVYIKDICTVLGDGLHGTPEYDEKGDFYFINGNNLQEGHITIKKDTKRVSQKEFLKYQKELNDRTILVSINGTIGNVAKYNNEPCILGKSACFFNVKEDIDRNFIYYVISSPHFKKSIIQQATGTTIKNVSLKQMRDYHFLIPVNLSDQRKIAGILSALDSKIENNNKINANLEAQAEALFKSWFVDFTPFKDQPFVDSELGPIPQGWKVGKLGDYCECVLGGTPSRSESSYWNGDIAWINSGEVNKFRICTPSEFITSKGLDNSSTKLLPKKTTVLAITGATLGQISILEIDSCANQSVIGIKQNDNMPYEFIYPTVKVNIKRLLNLQTGGAQQHINKNNVQNLFIVYPPKFILQKYKEHTKCIYSKISTLCFENQRLAALRDTLLPKLMSGEIKL
ncbi:MAG: restriction endonuclease subunit S [Bacteroidales bacterium]|nr:restriction endonuclease subunit S [Bacteroidales bacterium]